MKRPDDEGIIGTKPAPKPMTDGLWQVDALVPIGTPTVLHFPPFKAATSPTSQAARAKNAPKAPSQRERVWQALRSVWPNGLTRPEIAATLAIPTNSVNARCAELIAAWVVHDVTTGERDGFAVMELTVPGYATIPPAYDHRAITITLAALKARKEQP